MAAVVIAPSSSHLSPAMQLFTALTPPLYDTPTGDNSLSIFGTSDTIMCLCGQWTIFADHKEHEDDNCCGLLETSLLAIDTSEYYFHMSGGSSRAVCYTSTGGGNDTAPIITVFDILLADSVRCESVSLLKDSVAIDGYTLVGLLTTEHEQSGQHGMFSESFICAGLGTALASTHNGPKPMILASRAHYSPPFAPYWLSLCGLRQNLVVVQQFEVSSAPVDCRVSTCALERVEGLDEHSESLICLEDVFEVILASHAQRGGDRQGPLLLLSEAGMSRYTSSPAAPSNSAARHAHDIIDVLTAYQNIPSPKPPLQISSFLRGFAALHAQCHCLEKAGRHSCALLGDEPLRQTMAQLTHAAQEEAWQRAYGSLVWHAVEWFGAAGASELHEVGRHLWNMHFLYDSMFSIVTAVCEASVPSLDPSASPQSFVLTSVSAQSLLVDFLSTYSSFALSLGPSGRGLSASLQALGTLLGACRDAPLATQTQHADLPCGRHTITAGGPLQSLETSTVHVVIYLPAANLRRGREWIQSWKIACELCALAVTYVLVPYQEEDLFRGEGGEADIDYTVDGQLLRFVVLHLEDYMLHTVVRTDVVVLLLGLRAMAAFVPPGGAGVGLVPPVTLTFGNLPYRLHAPLLFACQSVREGTRGGCRHPTMRAFAGRAPTVMALLTHIANDPLAVLSGSAVELSVKQFLRNNMPDCAIDMDGVIFDFDRRLSDSPLDLSDSQSDALSDDGEEVITDALRGSVSWEVRLSRVAYSRGVM